MESTKNRPSLYWALLISLTMALSCSGVRISSAAELQSGDIVVTAGGTISVIDAAAGTVKETVYSGGNLRGVAIDANGIIITVSASSELIELDPATGGLSVTLLPSPPFASPWGVAIDANGDILITNVGTCCYGQSGSVIRIDRGTKMPTVVSTGGAFFDPTGITTEANGIILVADFNARTLFRVDPAGDAGTPGGAQTQFVHDAFLPNGSPYDVAIDSNGSIFVVDMNGGNLRGRIWHIDPGTGVAEVIAADENFDQPTAIDIEANGSVLVADYTLGRLTRINPVTGELTVLPASVEGAIGIAVFSSGVPNILVEPLVHDFGEIDAFTTQDAIVTISNTGGADLEVTGVAVTAGDTLFSITDSDPPDALPAPFTLSPGDDVFVTVTFFPTSLGLHVGTLTVDSDDPDDPIVDVSLIGNGLAGAVYEAKTALETAVDDAIWDGVLVGSGSGNSASGRLGAFADMIEAAGDLIEAGFIEDACGQLRSALRRVDGDPRPPDFVEGDAAETIAGQIEILRASLGCS